MHKSNLFNDTFDNISFSISGQFKTLQTSNNCKTTIQRNEDTTNKHNIVSLDDSVFNNSIDNKLLEDYQSSQIALNSLSSNRIRSQNTQIHSKLQINHKSLTQLSSWGLPAAILEQYALRKITTMFQWQYECLLSDPTILTHQKNLVYSAPTSAGKTLVAEILAIKTIVERGKKVIFILPFVSVVREKMLYFQDILGSSGIRVEGYMGSYNPPGGFKPVQVAICTMEKANALINRLLEEDTLNTIGAVIVDELHMLGDYSRGYLLELLLTKLLYMSKKNDGINIQIIGMSATLPNLDALADWLDASLYTTDFRPIPLFEQCHINGTIYDHQMNVLRKLKPLVGIDADADNILQLCLEPIKESCSVLIFCPSKQWCESLAMQIAEAFYRLGSKGDNCLGQMLRAQLSETRIVEVLEQLRRCPVGLDAVLKKTVSFAVAYHHAGLTMDERDIVEGAFSTGALRVLVATSTLSSGVNLPARRVIVRTPRAMGGGGAVIDPLAYRQMIGRAGRLGRDTSGDSVLVCKVGDEVAARTLMGAELTPVESCLEGAGKLKRAILEVISSGVATSESDVELFTRCTLLAKTRKVDENRNTDDVCSLTDPITEAVDFLIRNEFIRKQVDENNETILVPTSLARACLSASMAPDEGLALFAELERARRCIVLETDLHLVYLVTPYSACANWPQLDWLQYLEMWERLSPGMKRVGELVGVQPAYILRSVQNGMCNKRNQQQFLVHKRFYVALALQELINETPLASVADKYACNRGLLQALQQSAATFAGMVTAFSRQLGWSTLELLIGQFQDRIHFGVARELLDLMRLPLLNGQRARILYSSSIETLVDLANTSVNALENILHKATPFVSGRQMAGESEGETLERKVIRCVWIAGRQGLTEHEAAVLLVDEARRFLQLEMGLDEAKWTSNSQKSSLDKTEEDDSDGKLVDKMRDNTLDDVKSNDANARKPETKDIKIESSKLAILDQLFPDVNIDTESNDIDDKKIIIDVSNKISDRTTSIKININKLDEDGDYKPPLIVKLPSQKSLSGDNIDLDLSDKLSNYSFLNEDIRCKSKSTTETSDSVKIVEELNANNSMKNNITSFEFDTLDSPNLFDSSKESEENLNLNGLNESDSSNVSLHLELSLESKKSSLDENIYIDSQNLFDDSLDGNLAEITVAKLKENNNFECPHDSGLFEHDSVLEQAFIGSFNDCGHEEIDAKEPTEKIEQNTSDTIIEDSPKNAKTILESSRTMKRTRIDRNSLGVDEEMLLYSPKKKSKYKKNPKLETCIDYNDLHIIDVFDDKEVFSNFFEELLKQKRISISLACIPHATPKSTIGPSIANKKSICDSEFVHKGRKMVGISFSWGKNIVYYMELVNVKVISLLKTLFSKEELFVDLFDAKKQIKTFKNCCQFKFECYVNDPKVADWLIEPEGSEKNLEAMCLKYCKEAVMWCHLAGDCTGTGSLGCDIRSNQDPRIRASVEALTTWHLMQSIDKIMSKESIHIFDHFRIEMDCLKTLVDMELAGICVNMQTLTFLCETLKMHLREVETYAHSLAGRRFSLGSSTEVAKVLGLIKTGARSKKRVSTNKQVLESIDRPIAKLVMLWRKLRTTSTNLVQPLLRSIDASKGRIYGTCVTRTATGRVAMHEPNIQNVPRLFLVDYKTLNGKMDKPQVINCRTAFVSSEGNVLVSADYCQLELRLLAHFSADPVLCAIMRQKDQDVFRQIAARWNDIEEKDVTDSLRQNAKKLCYGIIYGMGLRAISDQLSITEEEAEILLQSFHGKYPSIRKYIAKTIKNCRGNGYVETINGRRRFLPNINHHHAASKSQAERQAVNTTIQGSAADIVKTAMVEINNKIRIKFKTSKDPPQLVLQIHDELLYEVKANYASALAEIIRTSMETSVNLSVPFPVKLRSGNSWGDLNEDLL